MIRKTSLITLFGLILALSILIFQENENGAQGRTAESFEKEISYWLDTFEPAEAYAKLKDKYRDNFDGQHPASHFFGEKLYEKIGVEGIGICDSNFGFGCFHGLIISSIIENGVESITELDRSCIERFGKMGLGCQHGIGHGILEFLGHSNIIKAYEKCELLDWKGSLLGCKSGAIMEYFFPFRRPADPAFGQTLFDEDKPYGICPSIPEKFQPSCYHAIRQLWQHSNLSYEKMGALCDNIENERESGVCFLGVGDVASLKNSFQTESTISSCEKMPREYGVQMCRAGAYWSFKDNKGAAASLLCENIKNMSSKDCKLKSDLTKY